MDLAGFVESIELSGVRCIESVAQLKLDPARGVDGWRPVEFEPALQMQAHPVSWGRHIESWFRMALDTDDATLSAAVSVVYQREMDDAVPDGVRAEFLGRVAGMTAVPYLRAEVQSLAAKLQLGDVVVPIVRQGDLAFGLESESTQ